MESCKTLVELELLVQDTAADNSEPTTTDLNTSQSIGGFQKRNNQAERFIWYLQYCNHFLMCV
jgi:hypothetical protein